MKSNRHLLYALFAKHKSGLSAPNGATMKVGYGEKGFVIIGNGLELTIAIENITDIDYFLKSSRSAITRGVAHGRRIYGKKVGGIIGAAEAMQYDFVISYTSGNKIKKVTFNVGGGDNVCRRIIEHFHANKRKNTVKMELSSSDHGSLKSSPAHSQKSAPESVSAKSNLIVLLVKAGELALINSTLSTTVLQREMKLGYAKAAKIMDELERHGVVSPSDGAKPRTVIMNDSQFKEWKLSLCKK